MRLRIVNERGKAMQAAAELARGGMSAVLGLDADTVRAVVERARNATGGRVTLANFNSPTQIVISGDLEAVQSARRSAARRRRETRRAAQRLGRVAQRSDGAGDRTRFAAAVEGGAVSRSRRST